MMFRLRKDELHERAPQNLWAGVPCWLFFASKENVITFTRKRRHTSLGDKRPPATGDHNQAYSTYASDTVSPFAHVCALLS